MHHRIPHRDMGDLEFVIAFMCESLKGLRVADGTGDMAEEYVKLACVQHPGRLSDSSPDPSQMSAREVQQRYQSIVLPLLATMPCFDEDLRRHGLVGADEACGVETLDGDDEKPLCPTCQARRAMAEQQKDLP